MIRRGRRLAGAAVLVSLVLGLLAVQGIAGSGTGGGTAKAAEPPSIVLLLTDDQRWDTLWAMPNVQSRLVARGVTFENSFVSNPVCCPSRATFLTGQYSHTNKVWTNVANEHFSAFDKFKAKSTIATWLDPSYKTGYFGKYLQHYGSEKPASYIAPGWDRWVAKRSESYFHNVFSVDGYSVHPEGYITTILADYAVDFINNSQGPLFMIWAPNAPHGPADPDPAFPADATAFSGIPKWRPPSYGVRPRGMPKWMHGLRWGAKDVRRTDIFRIRQLRTLLSVDRAVGRILDALEATGRLENTMVVFTSDNGYMWGEHRLTGKSVPYEESIRVPLVVSYPPLTPVGRTDAHVVGNVDFAVTAADLAGVASPNVDGRSYLPLLSGAPAPWRPDFLIEHWAHIAKSTPPSFCGVRTPDYAYVHYFPRNHDELYDINADPYELHNLIKNPPSGAVLATLKNQTSALCRPKPPPTRD